MFEKYTGTNNAQAQILGGLASDGLILTLKSGQGALFPSTFPFLLSIEKYNTLGQVTRREIVKCTNRSGDNLTIVRAFESCPSSFEATTQTQTPFAFDDSDQVSLVFTAGDHKDIQDELVRLESEKADDDEVVKITGNQTISGTKSGSFNIDTTGTIEADSFIGDGSGLTGIVSVVGATKSTFVAGENITAGNALYVSNGDGGRTVGRVYRTDATNTARIGFIGFATNTATTGNNVIVDTSGVSNTQTGLTVGSDYYLSNTAGAISTIPGTNVISVGKAVSATGIQINSFGKNNEVSIAISRVMTTASGAVVYTHNLGRIPKKIIILGGAGPSALNGQGLISHGVWDGINQRSVCEKPNSGVIADNSNIINVYGFTNPYNGTSGNISNITSTQFTINWTLNLSLSQTANFVALIS